MSNISDEYLDMQIAEIEKDIASLEDKYKVSEQYLVMFKDSSRTGLRGVIEQIRGNNRSSCYRLTFELENIELNLFYIRQIKDFLKMLRYGNGDKFLGFRSHMLSYPGMWMARHSERMDECKRS